MLSLLVACAEAPPPPPPATAPPLIAGAAIPTAPFAWDPAAGDPSVPAALGGPGFTGEGWTTRAEISRLGDPDAPQGGALVTAIPDWPPTLRVIGKDANTVLLNQLADVLYTPLLALDPVTLDLVPALATHWQVLDDGARYRFRLDPSARWSDGRPIVAEDVLATFRLLVDPTLLQPSAALTYGAFDPPTALSPYVVEVRAKTKGWRNLLSFAQMTVLPASAIGSLSGAAYLDAYQFRPMPVSGPYELREADIVTNERLTIRRRADWWGEDHAAWDGRHNLAAITFRVVRDPRLALTMLERGELDYWWIARADWYMDELPQLDAVRRGLLVRRRFFTDTPVGVSGIAINATRPPLADPRVRRALQLLFDRDAMIDQLFYGQYTPMNSYFTGPEASTATSYRYAPAEAVRLLAEAGFTEVDADGTRRRPDGAALEFVLAYREESAARFLTLYQSAAAQAGVRLALQHLNDATAWKDLRERRYELMYTTWGATLIPNPTSMWSSSLAATADNNNVTGYANPEVDALCAAYDAEADPARRTELLRAIDAILLRDQPYVLGWYNPAQRVAFWNQYGWPAPWEVGRFARREGDRNLLDYVWVDRAKAAALAAARADPRRTLDPGPEERRFW